MFIARRAKQHQSGQAYAETLVGFTVIGLFLFGAHHLWRYAEVQQATTDAVRFAAWERVAWEPPDNSVEKFALHKADSALADDTVLHQLSKPAAWRAHRSGIVGNGVPTAQLPAERRDMLTAALKSFVSPGADPAAMISVTTGSGWTNEAERWYRGRDPTFNTTTSLALDQDTYRTVNLTFNSQLANAAPLRLFDFLLPAVSNKKHLSLITNSWAASPPLMHVRTETQLLPFSTGDVTSGTHANRLAYFGLHNDSSTVSAGDFVGMAPWWNFVGGPNGMGGQYIVRQIGLDANAANRLIASGGNSYQFDPAKPADDLLLKAEMMQPEYFNTNAISSWHHRHTFVIDESAEAKAEAGSDGAIKARNSNIGKRKYRAASMQNPASTYFFPPSP